MNKQTIVSNRPDLLYIDSSEEYKQSIKLDGDCADNGAMKLLEYCRKFGYENFDLVFYRMSVDDYIKHGQMKFTDDDIDIIRKKYNYWSHVLVYNKKLNKYIDQSQGRIVYTKGDHYILSRLYASTEIYHLSAEKLLKISRIEGGIDLEKLTRSMAHTFVCMGEKRMYRVALSNWRQLKPMLETVEKKNMTSLNLVV